MQCLIFAGNPKPFFAVLWLRSSTTYNMAPKRRAQKSETEAPAKKANSEATRRSTRSSSKKTNTDLDHASTQVEDTIKPKKNPRKRANESSTKTQDAKPIPDTITADLSEGRSYWLMKAEPESRLEKGKDVKFSIDDLVAVEKEPWDGWCPPLSIGRLLIQDQECEIRLPGIT